MTLTPDTIFEPATGMSGANHPETSRLSARQIFGKSGSLRWRIWLALMEEPATDEELQATLGMIPNTQRPRRVELVKHGYARDSGQRRIGLSGLPMIVWEATTPPEKEEAS